MFEEREESLKLLIEAWEVRAIPKISQMPITFNQRGQID
jgi:hypothetical protein